MKKVVKSEKQILFEMRDAASDPAKLVQAWLKAEAGSISNHGFFLKANGMINNVARDQIWLYYRNFINHVNNKIRKFNKNEKEFADGDYSGIKPVKTRLTIKDIECGMNVLIDQVREENRISFIDSISCKSGENLDELRRFLNLLTGTTEEKHVALFAHWIWNLKQKINNRHGNYHMMPVFFGIQGVGKSETIKSFLKPLKDFLITPSVDEAVADKNYPMYQYSYVAELDELRGATKADVSKLKFIITANTLSTRKYYTQSLQNIPQNCMFIGSSNFRLEEQIVDSTGMRRFYQINIRNDLPKFWKQLATIDYAAIYKGVDENKSEGYIKPYLEEIAEDQKNLTAEDPLQNFILDYGLISESTKTIEIDRDILYKYYKLWCYNSGMKSVCSLEWFSRRLKTKEFSSVLKREKGRRKVYFLIPDDSVPAVEKDNNLKVLPI